MVGEYIVDSNRPDLKIELGVNADQVLVKELVEAISSEWERPQSFPTQPILLLLGGFQGSGKTSVVEALSSQVSLIVISSDEIRDRLFKRIPFSDMFVHTVHAVRNQLIERALVTKQHVIVDLFCTPIRIGLFRSLAKKSPYTVLTVYLDASKETLIKRMKTRAPKAGKYKGTLAELLADLKTYGDPDTGNYDLVLNSEQQSPQQISEAILQKIEDIQQL